MSTHRSVIKSAGIIGLGTLTSRILGFIRDVVIARLFGVYSYAQAFVIAFKIPNLFRDFVGEGAANAALVPVFSEYRQKHSKEEFWELANIVLNLFLVILAVIVLLGVILAPLVVRMIAPGFIEDPEKLAITIKLTRIIFPYLLLVCLAAYCTALLNSLKHFAVPAFAPCLLNVSVIIFVLLFNSGIRGLATGILVGGFLQLGAQIPVLYKKGFRLRFLWRFKHPAARLIRRLMLPRLLSSSIYQVNNFVDSIFGSLARIVGEGGVAGLYFAYRIILFPLGIFTHSLSQALLPTLSAQALLETHDKLNQSLSFGLRMTSFVILPASVALMVLSGPIISAIFQGGMFDSYSAMVTSRILFFYSFGMIAYAQKRILQSCFFALKDTWTPAKIAFIALVLNVAFNALLMFPLKIAGIALGTSISGLISCTILFVILKKKIRFSAAGEVYISFMRILAASAGMGFFCYFISRAIYSAQGPTYLRLVSLGVIVILGLFSYIVFCLLFGVRELRQLWGWIKKREIPHED